MNCSYLAEDFLHWLSWPAAVWEPVGAASVMEAYLGLSVSNQSDAGRDDF